MPDGQDGVEVSAEHRLAVALLNAHPETAVTFQIALQLQSLLPLESLSRVREGLPDGALTVGDRSLPVDVVEPFLPAEAFPIADEDDLATKVTAGVRIGLARLSLAGGATVFSNDEVAALANEVSFRARGGGQGGVGIGSFSGPSLFGVKRREG